MASSGDLTDVYLQATFNKNESLKFVCTKTYKKNDQDTQKKLNFLKRGIRKNYQHYWYTLLTFYHSVVLKQNGIASHLV